MSANNRAARAASANMKTTRLPSGRSVPVLGQGTWMIGDDRAKRRTEIAALRVGLALGMTLIDTAEMYGDGRAEELVGEAIAGRRSEVFLISKVLPQHATRRGTLDACERSLKRLATDYLDVYLLHWHEGVPLEETFEAFQRLKQAGKIRDYGVSNVDQHDMDNAVRLSGGAEIATNQVLYNLNARGIEIDLLPWCRRRGMPIVAYSPMDQGELLSSAALKVISARHHAAPAQIALAWVLRQEGAIAIPKAGNEAHVRQNRAALDLALNAEDLAELDAAFPPPARNIPLEVR